jgi:redox-sensitive bicupin YhaK (pirin superfamily)
LLSSQDGGSLLRVLAGEIDGHTGPGKSQTPMSIAHLTVAPGASVSIPWNPMFNALAYVLAGEGSVGEGEVGSTAAPIKVGQLAVFGQGDRLVITANEKQDSRTSAMEVFLLGGQPIREPVFQYGPFVMNDKQGVIQAMEDFHFGRFGQIPADAIQPFRG